MHKKKRKVNRNRIIGIIGLIVSMLLALGPVMILHLEKSFSMLIVLILFHIGCIGTGISAFLIAMPDTKNNEISKEILNHFFDATHKD